MTNLFKSVDLFAPPSAQEVKDRNNNPERYIPHTEALLKNFGSPEKLTEKDRQIITQMVRQLAEAAETDKEIRDNFMWLYSLLITTCIMFAFKSRETEKSA